jgi:hypothetical protein
LLPLTHFSTAFSNVLCALDVRLVRNK